MNRWLLTSLLLIVIFETIVVPVNAWIGTIYIMEDGRVSPSDAPIIRSGNVYTLTDDVRGGIHVDKGNIVIDGTGHKLRGFGGDKGVKIRSSNVVVKNLVIEKFEYGIFIHYPSSNIKILNNKITNCLYGVYSYQGSKIKLNDNDITHNRYGIYLLMSSDNNISGNYIVYSEYEGIYLKYSSRNVITKNIIKGSNQEGILLYQSYSNTITKNSMINNRYEGIRIYHSSDNKIYHNDFVGNSQNAYVELGTNKWDNGYPSGGNYWSDYSGKDNNNDGIGDTPYIIDANNTDRYPFINPLFNKFPVADFTYSSFEFYAGQTIVFDATPSYDIDGTIVKYIWDFGNGSTASGVRVTHTYSSPGTYTVTLTVTDDYGLSNSTNKTIIVKPSSTPTPTRTPITTTLTETPAKIATTPIAEQKQSKPVPAFEVVVGLTSIGITLVFKRKRKEL